MKKLSLIVAALVLAVSVPVVFAHDHARVEQHHYGFDYIPSSSDKGGYTGDLESGIVTVLEAKKLGNAKVYNTIIIGVAANHMKFQKEKWEEVIKNTVPPKTIDRKSTLLNSSH